MSNIKYLNDSNFQDEISNGVTLVDFYADWCGPCRMITPIVEELSSEMEGDASIGKLNIEEAQEVTAKYNVTSIPTLILFKNGLEVERVVGVKDIDTLRQLVNSHL